MASKWAFTKRSDPTPAQIQKATEKIRSQWSEREKRKRRGLPYNESPYEVPVLSTGLLTGRLDLDSDYYEF